MKIRTAAMQNRIPIMTTLRGADAALQAIKSLQGERGAGDGRCRSIIERRSGAALSKSPSTQGTRR